MNKLSFYQGYMCKTAGGPASALIEKVAPYAALLAAPAAGGYLLGRGAGMLEEPSSKELEQIQSEYVQAKFEQALADLERKKKIQRLQERYGIDAGTLRI